MSLKVIPLVIKSLMFAAMVDLMSINGEPVKKATGNYSAAARAGAETTDHNKQNIEPRKASFIG